MLVRKRKTNCGRNLPNNNWIYEPKSKIARSLAFKDSETWKKEARRVITTSSGEEYREYQRKCEFEHLVTQWTTAIRYYSLESQQMKHPAFLRIVAMGKDVLPYIFEEFSKRPFMAWLKALEAIVGNDIASEAASFREAVGLWLKWGQDNGYLQS